MSASCGNGWTNDLFGEKESPLQLIRLGRRQDFDESLEIHLDTDVLDTVLRTCNGLKVCVLTVTGHAVSGKGLLLNFIKERLVALEKGQNKASPFSGDKIISGFACNHGYKADSDGIWIWSRAFRIPGEDEGDEDIAVILMETQGFRDDFTRPDELAAVLGISLLVSSVVVVNLSGDLPNEVFDWLENFSDYGELFMKKGIEVPFQILSFLVRDWTQLSSYNYGGPSGKKLLTKMMKSNRNIAEKLERSVDEMDCFLLPNIGENARKQSFKGNIADLNKEFSKHLQTYVKNISKPDNLLVKKISGNQLSAEEWKHFFISYVDLFNDKSELEWGPPAESVWAFTKETLGMLKLDHAVKAYGLVYNQRLERSQGYLLESWINGLHIQAKAKALEAFNFLALPKEEEKYFKGKLEQRLEIEKEKLKQDNLNARTSLVTMHIGKACDKLRGDLEMKFPFTPEPGTSLAADMVFYDHLEEDTKNIIKNVQDQFLENFDNEEDEEISKLIALLHSVLNPISEEWITKNRENRNRAVTLTNEAKGKLMGEYNAGMKEVVRSLPDVNPKTLEMFHKKEVEKLSLTFKQLKLGGESFMQQLWEEILEEIENEYEVKEVSLEWTEKKALAMVDEEQAKYRNSLLDMANGIESDDKALQDYHKVACQAILNRFVAANPLRKDVPRAEGILRKLKDLLDSAYVEIVEHGIMVKRELEKNLKQALSTALDCYRDEMKMRIDEEGEFIMDDENMSNAIKEAKEKAFVLHEEKLHVLLGEDNDEVFEEEDNKLEQELAATAENDLQDNRRKRNLAESEAAPLFVQCNQAFEMKMSAAAGTLKTMEELVKSFEENVKQAVKLFEEGCTSQNKILKANYCDKLRAAASDIFSGVEHFFNLKKTTETAGVLAALVDVKQVYYHKMEGHFRSIPNGYYSEEELLKLHEKETKGAMEQAYKVRPSLNAEQLDDVKGHLNRNFEKYQERNHLLWKSFEENEPAIGIDLGTTYCCVAVFHRGKVIIVRNTQGENTTPSYVKLNQDGSAICGKPAKDLAFENPDSTIFDAKRIIGRRIDDDNLKEDMKFWPFTVKEVNGVAKIEVDGVTYFPEEISAKLLKHLKEEAQEILGLPIKKAVITVPAYFTDGQRKATITAGELAGLKVLGILNEPTAAAVAYRMEWFHAENVQRILIFDLGGGTFDVVILEMREDSITERTIGGDDHLGGRDFDKNTMEYCAEIFKQNTSIDLLGDKDSPDGRRRIQRLQAKCEEAKKQLSAPSSRSATISIAAFHQGYDLIVEVSKSEFEKRNAKLFQKTIDIVDDALISARLRKEDIHEIVLVGGSTRIPKLQKMLEEHFNGKALNKKINPDEAVAHGAAVEAARVNANPGANLFDFAKIQKVTAMSLGIETATKAFDVIIPKNTEYPVELTQEYRTFRDGQHTVLIKIYQGEHTELASANRLLGTFVLEGIPPAKAGKEAVNVTMTIDANGTISVAALCISTKGSKSITINEETGLMKENDKQLLLKQALSSAQVDSSLESDNAD